MKRTVLVVDDDPSIAALLCALLQDEGYDAHGVGDGEDALMAVAEALPDVIVADVMMPRLGGLEMTQALRDRGVGAPVVLMSAVYADVDLPGIRFVPKPFDLDELVTVVNHLVEQLDDRPELLTPLS
ncbi:MAG: response regulator [Thermomicrobiales bacterium]|nr:response regulator [Thermomicrobiales bacterium]